MKDAVQCQFRAIGGGIIDFPVGLCGDIPILFQHGHDFSEEKDKFERRAKRVNFEKICYIFMADSVDCDILYRFSNSSLRNRIILSSKKCDALKDVLYLDCGEKNWFDTIDSFTLNCIGKRYFQLFDFARYFSNIDS